MDVHFSSAKTTGRDDWETPLDFFHTLDRVYKFDLDVAADGVNHQTPLWLGPGGMRENALQCGWYVSDKPTVAWCNPPYSASKKFIEKAIFEAEFHSVDTVMLLPARTDTKYFHELVWQNASSIIFLKGRLKFYGASHSAPFPSMLVVFDGERVGDFPHCWQWDFKRDSYPVEARCDYVIRMST